MRAARLLAVSKRILRQLARDRRTLALIFVAPVAVLWLVKLLLTTEDYQPRIAVLDDVPAPLYNRLAKSSARLSSSSIAEAESALARNEIDAIIRFESGKPRLKVEGSDPTVTRATLRVLRTVAASKLPSPPEVEILHGRDVSMFESFGPILLGFFVFLFTFLVSGMSFVRERTSGTLERMLATPLRRHEVVLGYMIGFSLVALVQAAVIASVAVTLLDMLLVGRFAWLLVVVLLLALAALSLGMLLSAFARSEFQMFQLVPLVVVPQIFFSGLLQLESMSASLRALGNLLPLTYGAHALRQVMIRGGGLADIGRDLGGLAIIVVGFLTLNVVALRKYRRL
jgi:ABC-2 type transport system permease protein